jgi:hypothetical protein
MSGDSPLGPRAPATPDVAALIREGLAGFVREMSGPSGAFKRP